ncbi:MAG: glucose-1-phosphate thymidylyltransferase [Armatimonadetes bacterium 55-13]|nr:glucose-1-phosphate thymidylyltransferase [Armatimonadota bacterium]ODU53993.1 MAG: glucose-1-phosphate thymidylyltransferase [bacterium SCN 57-13]OJU62243.1 MAG: glucose-1-phosphate thymidylyltransferase [Armatimonadetes bacterium 55-13]
MKALILAGGTGSRLRPITYSMAKQLVPVANKPVIEYGIESIAEAGIKDFGIIVGDTGPAVEKAVGDGSRWGINITYIPQDAPLGLAHAVKTAQPFLGDDDFIMYLGDNLIKSSVVTLVTEFQAYRPAATILLTPVPNPSDFGVAELENDRVARLEEKPKNPRSNLALVGVYLFDRRIHDSIAVLKPSPRGEYEITDAIQGLIDTKLDVRSHIVEGWWKDTGTVDAMLEANRLILEDIYARNEGEVDAASKIEGRVKIGAGAVIKNSIVRGPAVIGANCRIENSFVGPFTALAENTTLTGTEIENSIVMGDCTIEHTPSRLANCLIGRGASIKREQGMPKTMQLVLGDSSSVVMP